MFVIMPARGCLVSVIEYLGLGASAICAIIPAKRYCMSAIHCYRLVIAWINMFYFLNLRWEVLKEFFSGLGTEI